MIINLVCMAKNKGVGQLKRQATGIAFPNPKAHALAFRFSGWGLKITSFCLIRKTHN